MRIALILLTLLSLACSRPAAQAPPDPITQTWPQIESQARGQTLNLLMWMGDPFINAYMRDYVAPALKQKYDITLNIGAAQGNQIVNILMTELEAKADHSEVDMAWINGETFYQLRQINALYGPFTDHLPNSQYLNFQNPFIGIDFQQPVDGFECPWGNVQLAVIYDSARVPTPPTTRAALADWVREHPGRFTLDSQFTGMTLLKSWLIELAGGGQALAGPFDEAKYQKYSEQLWAYTNEIKPYFWREGKSFPGQLSQLHQMFANGEVDFTFSNNDGEVDNKVAQGLFPESSRAFVFDGGTIQNSHFIGIPRLAQHKAAALVAINFMISFEAQLRKMDPVVWGDGTVLDLNKIPAEWADKFRNLPTRRFAPKREEIQAKALMEIAPQYMIRLSEDFRKRVQTL